MVAIIGRVTISSTSHVIVPNSTIVCLGDSITHGVSATYANGEDGGYRSQLADLLTAGNYVTSQVGSITDGPGAAQNHEGWNGLGIGGDGQTHNIRTRGVTALTTYQPDYCLLMGGTNDMLQPAWSTAANRATIASRLGDTLDALHAASADTRIIVATIPPIDPSQYVAMPLDGLTPTDSERTTANTGFAVQVASRSAWATLVDPASSMSVATHISDGVHPNATGYGVIAASFYAALRAFLTAQTPPSTVLTIRGNVSITRMQGRVLVAPMLGTVRAD